MLNHFECFYRTREIQYEDFLWYIIYLKLIPLLFKFLTVSLLQNSHSYISVCLCVFACCYQGKFSILDSSFEHTNASFICISEVPGGA